MSFVTSPSPSASKRQRKANYSDNEICVLLEEVMLGRIVLFAAFNHKITLQEKNRAWDRVTAAVNECGVAKRSRMEIKEKWKAMKADVLGRQRRAGQTEGGPSESPLPYEESILQIIGCESNLFQGVTAPYPASFVRPAAAEASSGEHGEIGFCHTVPVSDHTTGDEETAYGITESDCGMSPTFSTQSVTQPVCASTPLVTTATEATSCGSVPFLLPADVSLCGVTGGPNCSATLTSEPEEATGPPSTGSSTRWRGARGRSWKAPPKEFPADAEERVAFLSYLQSTTAKNNAKTALLEGRVEEERLLRVMRYRREKLEVAKLEREGHEVRVRAESEMLAMRYRREALEVEKLEKELGKST